MKKHGMTLADALEHVKSKRPIAAPNAGFMLQLHNFEKSLQGKPNSLVTWTSLLKFNQC